MRRRKARNLFGDTMADEPTAFQLEIMQFQDDIAAMETRLMNTMFADKDFDPEEFMMRGDR